MLHFQTRELSSYPKQVRPIWRCSQSSAPEGCSRNAARAECRSQTPNTVGETGRHAAPSWWLPSFECSRWYLQKPFQKSHQPSRRRGDTARGHFHLTEYSCPPEAWPLRGLAPVGRHPICVNHSQVQSSLLTMSVSLELESSKETETHSLLKKKWVIL